jgi:uncharacterized membrane protein
MHASSLPWLSLLALGAVHGINPAMGWLFAVARGLEQRDRRAVWRALGPLALGHALAIAIAVLIVLALGQMVPLRWLRWGVAAALACLGIDGLVRHRHVALGGMHVSARELATWSFLMASVHGAGLMVVPFVLGAAAPRAAAAMHHHAMPPLAAGVGTADSLGIVAPLIHTAGYLLVTALLAVAVYDWVGLRMLRRAWINVNALWAVALLGAAAMTLLV